MKKNESQTNKMPFEDAITELESIVLKLEAGEVPLQTALDMFQKGVSLVNHCNEKLTEAQGVVKLLCKSSNGELQEIPFKVENEESL